jgi:hypothetical protein
MKKEKDSMTTAETKLEEARLNPERRYGAPAEVLADDALSRAQKLEILRSWEVDARELQRAESENMAGGEANLLDEVRRAIEQLAEGDSAVGEQAGKQGALI